MLGFATRILLAAIVCTTLLLSAPAAGREILPGPLSGKVLRVIDGDTLTMRLRIWIGQTLDINVRIAGIDTPEIRGKCPRERKLAEDARLSVENVIGDRPVTVTDIQLEKYAGRVLATVEAADGTNIGSYLIAKGLARPYKGRTRDSWCND